MPAELQSDNPIGDKRVAEINSRLAIINGERDRLLAELACIAAAEQELALSNESLGGRSKTDAVVVAAKLAVYRRLFRGSDDVYARRWEDPKSGRRGYSPACRYDYRKISPIDGKPERVLLKFDDAVIHNHLMGEDPKEQSYGRPARDYVAGIYPLLPDETCWLLVADFDKETWEQDAIAYAQTCRSFDVQAAVERSRSGNGAHVWIFFQEPIAASLARKLGALFLTKTMENRPEIGLDSYDRFFPNQDTMPTGGFGNLIALPLQRKARKHGNSLFVDDDLVPFKDQIAYLAALAPTTIRNAIQMVEDAQSQGDIIGVRQVALDDEFDDKPRSCTRCSPHE